MRRMFSSIGACVLAAAFCASTRAQDSSSPSSPSLGDLARQAQKDKASKPATAKVITNDDMSGDSGSVSSALGTGAGHSASKASPADSGSANTPEAGIAKLQEAVDHLESLDRASLAQEVLQGNPANFPGRAQWEEKMFAAKQTFVSQLRGLIQQAIQVEASAQGLKSVQDPNDPRVKALKEKLKQLMGTTVQNTATFQAIAEEGKDLAAQPAH
jgi:hypothetical protein